MAKVKKRDQNAAEAKDAPRGGMPGDGAGRVDVIGRDHPGVRPVSGPPSGNPEARIRDMASFGQGERGAAGYEDSGRSEVVTMPPDDTTSATESESGGDTRGQRFGEAGGNVGEVDPGIGGSGEVTGEQPSA